MWGSTLLLLSLLLHLALCNDYGHTTEWRDRRDIVEGSRLSLRKNKHQKEILTSFTVDENIADMLDPYGDYLVNELFEQGRLVAERGGVAVPAEPQDRSFLRLIGHLPELSWNNIGPMNTSIFEANLDYSLHIGKREESGDEFMEQSTYGNYPDSVDEKEVSKVLEFSEKFPRAERTKFFQDAISRLANMNVRYLIRLLEAAWKLNPDNDDISKPLIAAYFDLEDYDSAYEHIKHLYQKSPEIEGAQMFYDMILSRMKRMYAAKSAAKLEKLRPDVKSLGKVSLKDLHRPENQYLLNGDKPFVIRDVVSKDTLNEYQRKMEAVLEYFSDKTMTSYNPFGVHHLKKYGPQFSRASLKRSIKMLEFSRGQCLPAASSYVNASQKGQHAQWMPTSLEWFSISRFLGIDDLPLPEMLKDEASGLFLGGGFGNRKEKKSLEEALPLRFITLGSQHSGQFMHQDSVLMSAWQLQIMGAKTWFICPQSESPYIGDLPQCLDAHHWNSTSDPQFAFSRCTNTTVFPGEIIYYPTEHWHQTLYHVTTDGFEKRRAQFDYPWDLSPINIAVGHRVVEPAKADKFGEYLETACQQDKEKAGSSGFFTKNPEFCTSGLARYKRWMKNRFSGDYIHGMGDSCSSEDAEKAALEIEADQPYEKLLEAITEELQESYKLIQKEYGEDRRRNKV